jgi:hypothetical protein
MRLFLPGAAPVAQGASAAPGLDAATLARRVSELEQRLDQMAAGGKKSSAKKPSGAKGQG